MSLDLNEIILLLFDLSDMSDNDIQYEKCYELLYVILSFARENNISFSKEVQQRL